jgi:hypothetical protein
MHWTAFTVICLEQTQIPSDAGQVALILYLYRILYIYETLNCSTNLCVPKHTHTHSVSWQLGQCSWYSD